MKGQKTLSKGTVAWAAIFICYLVVVMGATLLDRRSFYQGSKIAPLFYSYKEAWIDASITSWRNIVLNIFMFVPFGFLFPLGIKKFQSCWKTSLCGFAFTILIELVQLISGKGIFECDDILNNVIGTMIGYGIFEIWKWIVSKEKKAIRIVFMHQIPLLLTCTAFLGIYAVYTNQELGNLNTQYVTKINQDLLNVESEQNYIEEETMLPVYCVPYASVAETQHFAEAFFENLGDELDASSNDIYDETAVYKSKNGYSLWMDYNGMNYSFTDFNTLFSEDEIKPENNAEEETIRQLLTSYSVFVPEGAVFENKGNGSYIFTAEQCIENDVIYNGTITCDYYKNGKFAEIDNHLLKCEYAKEYPAISEKEAFEMICSGKFRMYADHPSLHIKTGDVQIDYRVDSKGFYQPVYVFAAKINGEPTQIEIPALK